MRITVMLPFILGFMLVGSQLFSCDVNIFSLVSGTSKSDEFNRKTSEIAQLVQDFGQNSSDKDKAPLFIQKLMKKWIDYSGSYDQFPPEWAKNDPEWRNKLNDLTDIIGSINKSYVSDSGLAHSDTLKFSRRLTFLFECMPMSRVARLMLAFPGIIDRLWTAYDSKNIEQLRSNAAIIVKASSALPDQLPEDVRGYIKNFLSTVGELHKLAVSEKPFDGLALNVKLTMVEDEFAEINKELNKLQIPLK